MKDCLYLHKFGKPKDTFDKEKISSNKSIFEDQQKLAIKNI